jgi:hypothetical protein
MGAVVCCPSCGHVHQVILSDAEYAARFPGNAGQPAAPAPAAAGQPPRQADPAAPLCNRCGVNRVNRRRNGSWFPTCFSCN